METSCPEKAFDAIEEASVVLESRGIVDRQFPDLKQAFSNRIIYETAKSEKVKPVVLKTTLNMPISGIEGINQLKPDSPAGISPEINRAYFAIGKCLYLWDYVNGSNDMNIYEEEDDIVGIGFVRPKPDVFNSDKVYRLLIVSTVSQVKLIAISKDATDGIRFHQTDTHTSTSGINMKSIVGTSDGRVFMLGNDGNVWELDYRQTEGWFTGKCSKRLHSSGIFSALFLSVHDPVIQIAVNEAGRVLYQLTEHSHIIVTYLGKNGQDYQTITTYSKSCESSRLMCPNSPLINANNFKIISIHPVSIHESRSYQLVAITSSGCRLYYTYHQHGDNLKSEDIPSDLALIHVRTPPENTLPGQVFSKSTYKDGFLALVKNDQQKESVFTICPDLGKLVSTTLAGRPSLTEFVDEITVAGKIVAMSETSSTQSQVNELAAHYTTPTRHLLVLTTCGLSVLIKQRPVDMLFSLVSSSYQDTAMRINNFKDFFDHFGYSNSCAMSFGLVTSSIPPSGSGFMLDTSQPVVSQTLETVTILLQEFSRLLSDLPSQNQQYTSRHDGLALFIYRTIRPIWDKPLFTEILNEGKNAYINAIKKGDLLNIQIILKNLVTFIESHSAIFPKNNATIEEKSIKNMYELAVYLIEAVAFFVYLIDTGEIAIITQSLKTHSKERLKSASLKQLLTTTDGRSLVRDLSGSLIEYTFKKQNYDTEYVISILQQNCGSFCDANVVLLHRATHDIHSARSAPGSQTKAILNSSLHILQKIAAHIPAPSLAEIAKEFTSQGYPVYGVNIALACAKARDPNNTTNELTKAGYLMNDSVAGLFNAKQPFYDTVFDILLEVTRKVSISSVIDVKKEVYSAAFSSDDITFHHYMYEKFMEHNIEDELIKESPSHLEEYLNIHPLSYKRLRVLAKYYRKHEQFEKAAKAYITLGQSEGLNNQTRFEYLTNASICAKSVTSPAKQYEMYHLLQTVSQLLESIRE
ncbi:hypothetical protein G6F37_007484 [Rhizopus arrhizus]|nr:hypothetical protein G6F38_007566 [Rhizopus arrhizus]KAG1156570.1 hypothetical protein G6F37_007484 [Rhizopus arrhizus]